MTSFCYIFRHTKNNKYKCYVFSWPIFFVILFMTYLYHIFFVTWIQFCGICYRWTGKCKLRIWSDSSKKKTFTDSFCHMFLLHIFITVLSHNRDLMIFVTDGRTKHVVNNEHNWRIRRIKHLRTHTRKQLNIFQNIDM